jgi:tyrosinase
MASWREGAENGWHEDLIWYAAALHQMRLRTPKLDEFMQLLAAALDQGLPQDLISRMSAIAADWSDPQSLGYQSQVHGTFVPVAQWPKVAGRRALWLECAHNHWFFLPWHRAYLLEFEAVARAHIEALGGPASTWGLPYWNYTDFQRDPRRLGLPLPLRAETLPGDVVVPGVDPEPDGTRRNPLFNAVRELRGDLELEDASWADASAALQRPHFANQQDTGRVSFGGGVLESPNNQALFHDRTREHGLVDVQPHGSVHMEVHGAMALFQTAGLEPVFWMHHCNIDRLWETYAHQLGHGYPFEDGVGEGTPAHKSWIARQFRFLRGDGAAVEWTAPQVLDIEQLGYSYDTTAAPPLPPTPPPPDGSENQPFGLDAAVLEPVAVSDEFALSATMDVPLTGGSGDDITVAAFPAEASWVLRFEGIRSQLPAPTSFRVYLGLAPEDEARADDADHYVGLLSLFGVYEASRDDGFSPADGQRRSLDATRQVKAQSHTLRPFRTRVRLVPIDANRELSTAGVTVGRLSLEFA